MSRVFCGDKSDEEEEKVMINEDRIPEALDRANVQCSIGLLGFAIAFLDH